MQNQAEAAHSGYSGQRVKLSLEWPVVKAGQLPVLSFLN